MTKPEMDRRGPKMPLALCLIAIVAPGLSCSGSAEEADSYGNHYESPTPEESASFLAALRDMESSRTDTGESPRVFFFEDTSLEAAWDTARWEVPALKSWPEFNKQGDLLERAWFAAATTLSATARGEGGSPQEALLDAIDNWASFLGGADVTGSVDGGSGLTLELLDPTHESIPHESIRSSSQLKLGPFEYEFERSLRTMFTDSGEASIMSKSMTTRRRISRSGQSYSSVTKMEVTDSATGSSVKGGFFPKTDGLELTDIVRGLIEYSVPPNAYSFIFLSSNDGEFYEYMAYVTGTDLSKSK